LNPNNNNKTISVSTDCKTDTKCFSNRCFNNVCIYNENANVENCDTLYTKPPLFSEKERYKYCGRMLGESCTKDIDCSSKYCKDNTCHKNYYEPSNSI